MAWRYYSVSSLTWKDWIELPADQCTGGRALNTGVPGVVTFNVADPKVDEVVTDYTIEPLARVLVAAWDDIVKYAGYILDPVHDVDRGTVTADLRELWWIFNSRHVLRVHGEGSQLAEPIAYAGKSLATIAKGVILEGANAEPQERYALPIAFPPDVPGDDARTYEGFKFMSVADALDELMKTDGGPDIDLSPEKSPEGNLEWEFRAAPGLGYNPREWDTTASGSEVFGITFTYAGSGVSNKVIGTGEGSGRSLLVKSADSMAGTRYPAIERVTSYQGIKEPGPLEARTRADLAVSDRPTSQLSFKIPCDGPVEVSDLILGGECRVKTKGVKNLPDGWSTWRLIQYTFDRDTVTLQMQPQGG